MAAHVGAQTARSVWLHGTGEAHQEHHHRLVPQTPSELVLADFLMCRKEGDGSICLKEAKRKELSLGGY